MYFYNYLFPPKEVILDTNKEYLPVEFLTEQQKIKKDLALKPLIQQAKSDPETIIPFQEHYQCSHRFTFKAPQKIQEPFILVKDIIANIILSQNEQTRTFYQNNVNGIHIIMRDGHSLSNNDMVPLCNQNEIYSYDPIRILEIIYIEKSFWERVKNKTKQTVKKIPSLFATLAEKLLSFILAMLGLNGGITSIIWKAIPTSQIMSVVAMIVTMFFPALGPILGLSKFIF